MNSTLNESGSQANSNTTLPHKELGVSTSGGGHVVTSLKELYDQRLVKTHDSQGIPLLMGNRAFRRSHIKNRGTSKPKQYHKQGS